MALGIFALLTGAACRRTGQAMRATAQAMAEEPETGSAAAVYQRYRFRRQRLDSMRADLQRLVAAESVYFADPGKYSPYTSCVTPPTEGAAAWCQSAGNAIDGIHLTPHGWWTSITNLNTAIHCAVEVGPDTSFGVPAGTPVCFDVSTPPPGYPKSPL